MVNKELEQFRGSPYCQNRLLTRVLDYVSREHECCRECPATSKDMKDCYVPLPEQYRGKEDGT